jgi:hypothetical protein
MACGIPRGYKGPVMPRTAPGGARPLVRALAVAIAGVIGAAGGVRAVELIDGRVQIHGFVETQLRAMNSGFSEELDLAQWYNVLNLEFELDVAPRGFGPVDLVQAYVRVEGRYDAIYSQGFGIFPSVDTYGDFSNRLPTSLRDARDTEYGGTQPAEDLFGNFEHPRISDKKPAPIELDCRYENATATDRDGNPHTRCIPAEREGYPDFDTFFRVAGHDNVIGNDNDPGRYYLAHALDYHFAYKAFDGPDSSPATNTQRVGPWLPRNFIRSIALNPDRANPFRGRVPAMSFRTLLGGSVPDPSTLRYYAGDRQIPAGFEGRVDPLDPRLEVIRDAPDSVLTDFRPFGPGGAFDQLNDVLFVAQFGGDFSGVVPCLDPTSSTAESVREGTSSPEIGGNNCFPGSTDTATGAVYTTPSVQQITGGRGEAPFRPAPDVSNLEAGQSLLVAQGAYIPSPGLQRELRRERLDSLDFNFTQTERSWNRGASQQRTKELKEAYLDIEMLEHRLWMRLGLQNIVWGKTELFRTTDQFNPQDLALSSLPTLEESRISLWSARFVYSLYDVGPLEDVRLEFAMNLDQYEPADLGACGEPYTADPICELTAGFFAHSVFGTGVAGVDRPENPWNDVRGLEFGGRIEWRWDRFSFALTDFYGYEDFPYPDAIFYYERNVDLHTGRPLVGRLVGAPVGTCIAAGEIAVDLTNGISYSTAFASHVLSVTPGVRYSPGDDPIRGGIGTDGDCLRPGGAVGEANAFVIDPESLVEQTNALYNHHANQQLFAWLCGTTIGMGAALDASSCSWTLLGSDAPLVEGNAALDFPFVEIMSWVLSGELSAQGTQHFLNLVNDDTKDTATNGNLFAVPLASLNSLQNDPTAPIGVSTADSREGFDGFSTLTDPFGPVEQSLDATLTNEQRALLGCGPFYGTRCDSSVANRVFGAYGGVDFLNAEASALLQSWPGFEGTLPGHTATTNLAQPGTIGSLVPTSDPNVRAAQGFDGGPVCERFDGYGGLIKLPGCRGIESLRVEYDEVTGDPERVLVEFESGYLPSIDGCILGDNILRSDGSSVPVVASGGAATLSMELPLCSGAARREAVPAQLIVRDASGNPVFDPLGNPITRPNDTILPGESEPVIVTGSDGIERCTNDAASHYLPFGGGARDFRVCNAQTIPLEELPLIHPLAGCVESELNPGGSPLCDMWMNRDLVDEFFEGTAQMFQNELASVSWNLLMFLAIGSCDIRTVDLNGFDRSGRDGNPGIADDPECYNPRTPYSTERCSFNAPQLCRNVKNFFTSAGVTRNTVRAGGNPRFGRRTFIWHSGGEAILRYEKRNVLGFATDFAEDRSKTNWSMEFTWIDGIPFVDNDSGNGITESDVFNLTLSVDRPTFINFLNPNRTFFFNSQWFFSYVPKHGDGFTTNGPVNVLFTFAVATGYYQDRLMPQFTTVYDFLSRSGGVMPSLQYRFTDSFSVTVGLLVFFGRTQLVDMPVRDLAPAANRTGPNAYKNGVDNQLSAIRRRDEMFLRLRWTF